MPQSKPKLVRGIYVPTPTFFNNDQAQSLDIEAHEKHILWLAQAGVNGFLIQGSTGEAVSLSPAERIEITRATRQVLDKNGFESVVVMAGAGAQSVAEAVALSKDAKDAGADYVVLLPPAYFASSITKTALEAYYTEVADRIPLPIIVYSYPAVSGGIDISSNTIATLAKHPNIVGVKQTDHNVGKMARNVWLNSNEDFKVLGGASDYLIGALAVGAHGAITGIANITPRVVLRLVELYDQGKIDEARALQGELSVAEAALHLGGIPGIKVAVDVFLGRGGLSRRPIPPPTESLRNELKKGIEPIWAIEQKLIAEANQKD